MSYIRVWVHLVWATKHRIPTLTDPYRDHLFRHIQQNALEKNILLDRINGYLDHVHCLISLDPGQTIKAVTQLLKGESSYWFNNKSGFKTSRLEWQKDYFAVSVSESKLDVVRNYIDNQVEHHRKKTFAEEYEKFMNGYGFKQKTPA